MNDTCSTIVLIENYRDEAEFFITTLQILKSKHKVSWAENGVDGLQLVQNLIAEQFIPCLIVLDINMPLMNGKLTALELRKITDLSAVPIAILSTSSSLADRTFFQTIDMLLYTKPTDYQTYLSMAKHLLSLCD